MKLINKYNLDDEKFVMDILQLIYSSDDDKLKSNILQWLAERLDENNFNLLIQKIDEL